MRLRARDHVGLDQLRCDRDRDLFRRSRADLDPDRCVQAGEVGLADPASRSRALRSLRVFSLPIAPMKPAFEASAS